MIKEALQSCMSLDNLHMKTHVCSIQQTTFGLTTVQMQDFTCSSSCKIFESPMFKHFSLIQQAFIKQILMIILLLEYKVIFSPKMKKSLNRSTRVNCITEQLSNVVFGATCLAFIFSAKFILHTN